MRQFLPSISFCYIFICFLKCSSYIFVYLHLFLFFILFFSICILFFEFKRVSHTLAFSVIEYSLDIMNIHRIEKSEILVDLR